MKIQALALALPLFTPGEIALGQDDGFQIEEAKIARRRTPVVEVVERARPAIVSIDCNVRRDVWGIFNMPVSGTGVVLYEEGIIVTNNHVIAPGGRVASEILVRFDEADDETVYKGRVISTEPLEDLALVKIEGDAPFPTIQMSTSDPMLGEMVVAIGNAVGQTHTVSTGIISGLHRDLSVRENNLRFKSLIQTDAAINPGNSGGPLLDINGDLIGINTAITRGAENIGFAIPVARVRSVLATHLLAPSQARSYLGYVEDEETFVVRSVLEEGPAELAGLRPGDRLVAFDGKRIEGPESYGLLRLSIQADQEVRLTVERDGRELELDLESWSVVDGAIHRRMGVTVRPIQLGRSFYRYLQLATVAPDGPAGRIGLQPGDVIAAVRPDGRRSTRLERAHDLAMLVARLEPDTTMDIEVWRDDDGDGSFERNADVSELYSGALRLR
jgi:S1-C subfamily serine protease